MNSTNNDSTCQMIELQNKMQRVFNPQVKARYGYEIKYREDIEGISYYKTV